MKRVTWALLTLLCQSQKCLYCPSVAPQVPDSRALEWSCKGLLSPRPIPQLGWPLSGVPRLGTCEHERMSGLCWSSSQLGLTMETTALQHKALQSQQDKNVKKQGLI